MFPAPGSCNTCTAKYGAPCEFIVKRGDAVKTGQKIADTDKFVSGPCVRRFQGRYPGASKF
ncbi:MAG: hypothetical protein U5N58_08040 [Actinomycetota bacterium]|nr:hypothetical protein [Actinomycetota bacterium]